MEFSGAAEGLGYNDEALKDLFNSALDEPLSWWRMSGLDHLTFGEFVESLAHSPAKVAGVPQVVGDKAAPPVAADEMSLCVEHMACLLVPCAPMSIVCPLPSCYLIIVSVAPAVSPSLPSFVSLYSLLVSAVLC